MIDAAILGQLASPVAASPTPVTQDELAESVRLSTRKLTSALHWLEDEGAIRISPTGEISAIGAIHAEDTARAAVEVHEEYVQARRERLEQMRSYAQTSTCCRELLLQYLGDSFAGPCNGCDNCEARTGTGEVELERALAATWYKSGDLPKLPTPSEA